MAKVALNTEQRTQTRFKAAFSVHPGAGGLPELPRCPAGGPLRSARGRQYPLPSTGTQGAPQTPFRAPIQIGRSVDAYSWVPAEAREGVLESSQLPWGWDRLQHSLPAA